MNRIVWFGKEDELKERFEKECAYRGAKRYVVTGAVPSASEFIPQPDLIIDDRRDKVPERVNVPTHMWTAACCDTSDISDDGARSFFTGYVAENRAGGRMELFEQVANLTERLSELYNHTVTILADACQTLPTTDGSSEVFG